MKWRCIPRRENCRHGQHLQDAMLHWHPFGLWRICLHPHACGGGDFKLTADEPQCPTGPGLDGDLQGHGDRACEAGAQSGGAPGAVDADNIRIGRSFDYGVARRVIGKRFDYDGAHMAGQPLGLAKDAFAPLVSACEPRQLPCHGLSGELQVSVLDEASEIQDEIYRRIRRGLQPDVEEQRAMLHDMLEPR